MIIDFHTHIYPDNIAAKAVKAVTDPCGVILYADGTAKQTREKLIERGITKAVVLEIATKASSADGINDYALNNLADDFFIPFATVHPEGENNPERIKRIREAGFKGIKLHPYFQEFNMLDESALEIYEAIANEGLILTMHSGFDPSYPDDGRAAPVAIAKVKEIFPNLKLVAAHFGGMKQAEEVKKYLLGTDIYFDISMTNNFYDAKVFEEMLKSHDENKLLFGSDSPWDDPNKQIAMVRNADISEEFKEKIFYKNARTLLDSVK